MNKVFNKIFVKIVEKFHCIQFFYVLRPFCYEQTSPLDDVATFALERVCDCKPAPFARLLLFPLKSCDFRGPRKVHRTFWGEEKQGTIADILPNR